MEMKSLGGGIKIEGAVVLVGCERATSGSGSGGSSSRVSCVGILRDVP